MRAIESGRRKKAARLPPARKPVKRRLVSASPSAGRSTDPCREFSNEEWHDMVETAAYYRSEARGCDGGSAEQDWYEAEAQMRERFAERDSEFETISPNPGGEAADIETKGE